MLMIQLKDNFKIRVRNCRNFWVHRIGPIATPHEDVMSVTESIHMK